MNCIDDEQAKAELARQGYQIMIRKRDEHSDNISYQTVPDQEPSLDLEASGGDSQPTGGAGLNFLLPPLNLLPGCQLQTVLTSPETKAVSTMC